jgi:sec-independent protein translocase protein TatC
MPVMDHLRELRRRVVIMLVIIAAGAVVAYIFYNPILDFIKAPYCHVPKQYRFVPTTGDSCPLIYQGVLEGFTTRLKVAAIGGAVLTGPLWLYQIWAFITPGLKRNERRYTVWFITASTLLFAAGVTLAYVVLSKGLRILVEQAGYGTQALLTVGAYINFVVLMLVVFGAAFEVPLIVVLANFAGVLPSKILRKTRRIAIFLIFLFAAVATPTTDPFTMCAMAVPMAVLYEVAVQVAGVHDKRKARRKAEAAEAAVAAAAAGAPAREQLADDVPSAIDPIPRRLALGADPWGDTT